MRSCRRSSYSKSYFGPRRFAALLPVTSAATAALADLHNKQAALLFTSGYVSNWAGLGTLAGRIPGCVVFSDGLNHASMIEGSRYSKEPCRIWNHNDPADLDRLLTNYGPEVPKLVAFESVYSMDGDIAPIAEILAVCEKHGAISYSDEVHAVGLYEALSDIWGQCELARRSMAA